MIPSLQALGMKPGDMIRRETRGASQREMVKLQKQTADLALKQAIDKLLLFDQKLTEATPDRVRDGDYSKFKIVFVPGETYLIFHFGSPAERRQKYKKLMFNFIIKPSEALRVYMQTTSRFEVRKEFGALCTNIISLAYSCLGIFDTKWIPLIFVDDEGDESVMSMVDSVNEFTNDQWPNVINLYEHVYHSHHPPANDPLLPVLAGLKPTYTKEPDGLTGFAYTLN